MMKKFTEDEKIIARNIDKKYKWIARDKCGVLFAFPDMPIKKETGIWGCDCYVCINALFGQGLFNSIKWEDDEPTLIEDIYDPHPLNNKEKEYLRDVFRPFKNRVSSVIKKHSAITNAEFIAVKLTDNVDSFMLPYFEENKMYIGMKSGHPYSLRELGITYDD